MWEYQWRVVVALVFLVTAKLANVGVPLVLKEIVDSLDPTRAVIALPFALLLAYGALRLSNTMFAELRDVVFVRVTQRAIRRVALTVYFSSRARAAWARLIRPGCGIVLASLWWLE